MPRNGVPDAPILGIQHPDALVSCPWAPAEHGAVVVDQQGVRRLGCSAHLHGSLCIDSFRDKRRLPPTSRKRSRSEFDSTKFESRHVLKVCKKGAHVRGMIRPGRVSSVHPPQPRLPDISESPFPGGSLSFSLLCVLQWDENLVILQQRAISALANCRAGCRMPTAFAAGATNVSVVPRSEASLKRSALMALSEP